MYRARYRHIIFVISIQFLIVLACLFKGQNQFSVFEASTEFSLIEEIEDKEQKQFSSLVLTDLAYFSFFLSFVKYFSVQNIPIFFFKRLSYLTDYLFRFVLSPPVCS
jgi:hypothetical protein